MKKESSFKMKGFSGFGGIDPTKDVVKFDAKGGFKKVGPKVSKLDMTLNDKLNKAVRKNFGVKNLSPIQAKLVNDALRGRKAAVQELAKDAPDVLEQVQKMRDNVTSLQEDLLATGAIRDGSNLETKIKSSMGTGGKDELYLTTSYEKFDNPNWGK